MPAQPQMGKFILCQYLTYFMKKINCYAITCQNKYITMRKGAYNEKEYHSLFFYLLYIFNKCRNPSSK